MNKRMILMLLACVVVFGGVFGVQVMINKGMNDFFDDMPMPAVSITVTDAEEDTWPVRLSAVGTAKAVNGTQLTTEAAGIVNKINFRRSEERRVGKECRSGGEPGEWREEIANTVGGRADSNIGHDKGDARDE